MKNKVENQITPKRMIPTIAIQFGIPLGIWKIIITAVTSSAIITIPTTGVISIL